jgi:hypothetical protein
MLASMAVFQVAAAFATFIPAFVHDRVPEQFVPVWMFSCPDRSTGMRRTIRSFGFLPSLRSM